jgi:polyphosphate kinase
MTNLSEPILSKSNFINREISSLAFQKRVFEEAQGRAIPLLERVKFISILGSNLDEFFMVRVGGLVKQYAHSSKFFTEDMSPTKQLVEIHQTASQLLEEAQHYFNTILIPELRQAGIYVLNLDELDEGQIVTLKDYFNEIIYPILTPLAFDHGHPFPHISNLSMNLAVIVKNQQGETNFARLKLPDSLPYLIPLKPGASAGAFCLAGPGDYRKPGRLIPRVRGD